MYTVIHPHLQSTFHSIPQVPEPSFLLFFCLHASSVFLVQGSRQLRDRSLILGAYRRCQGDRGDWQCHGIAGYGGDMTRSRMVPFWNIIAFIIILFFLL